MRMILRMTLLVTFTAIGCSCAWFDKRPVETPTKLIDFPGLAEPSRAIPSQAKPAGAESTRPEAQKPVAAEAMTVLIKADPQLNRFGRNAHALFMCVYQLKDPNGFNQLAEEKDGIPKLLECSRFDASVANAKQFVVQPGQELSEVRDRAEGARYIAIATGYFGTGKEKVTELSPLGGGTPSGNAIQIELGPHQITSVKVK